jgi:hypothetical protein
MKCISWFILIFLTVGCTIFPSPESLSSPSVSTLPSVSPTSIMALPAPSPLPQKEAEALILELLQYNPDCLFPCWFGLTPGETDDKATKALFEKLAAVSLRTTLNDDVDGAFWRINKDSFLLDTITSAFYDQSPSNTLESLRITIEVKREAQGGELKTAWENPLNEELLQAYRLPSVLSTYKQPRNVLIFANEGWRYFELVLDYSDQGFVIWYSAPLDSEGEKYLGCPEKAFVNLYLWTLDLTQTWVEGVTGSEDPSEIDSLNRDFQPLEDVTSMTLDKFYDAFVNVENDTCLETLKELWPGP